jgi:cation:H+ antiporter
LTVAIVSARKGKGDLVIGNIIGSNIFNSLVVLGLPALFKTLVVVESSMIITLIGLLVATAMLYVVVYDKTIRKYEGYIMFIIYLIIMANVFGWV